MQPPGVWSRHGESAPHNTGEPSRAKISGSVLNVLLSRIFMNFAHTGTRLPTFERKHTGNRPFC
jgi:hypothetical protein